MNGFELKNSKKFLFIATELPFAFLSRIPIKNRYLLKHHNFSKETDKISFLNKEKDKLSGEVFYNSKNHTIQKVRIKNAFLKNTPIVSISNTNTIDSLQFTTELSFSPNGEIEKIISHIEYYISIGSEQSIFRSNFASYFYSTGTPFCKPSNNLSTKVSDYELLELYNFVPQLWQTEPSFIKTSEEKEFIAQIEKTKLADKNKLEDSFLINRWTENSMLYWDKLDTIKPEIVTQYNFYGETPILESVESFEQQMKLVTPVNCQCLMHDGKPFYYLTMAFDYNKSYFNYARTDSNKMALENFVNQLYVEIKQLGSKLNASNLSSCRSNEELNALINTGVQNMDRRKKIFSNTFKSND